MSNIQGNNQDRGSRSDQAGWLRRLAYWADLWLVDHGFLRALYANRFRLPGGLYRANQPSPSQLKGYMRRFGIRQVMNLRGSPAHRGFYALEKSTCQALGLPMQDMRTLSRGLLTQQEILDLVDAIGDMRLPALAHCKSGADRAGFFAVLYRHVRLGEPIEQAMAELHWVYGHFKSAKTGLLDAFFQTYLSERRPRQSFLTWVRQDYVAEVIVARFHESGFSKWLVDFLLRRE